MADCSGDRGADSRIEDRTPAVRVVYIVPVDAEPWPEAAIRVEHWLADMQRFFAQEMTRHGYGSATFRISLDMDRSFTFSRIGSPLTVEQFLAHPVSSCKRAAIAHGLRNDGEMVIYFGEAYSIRDGTVSGCFARGGKRGAGGEVFLSSLLLKLARREWLGDNAGYGGKVFDWISPIPMDASTLSWNGRGSALGDVSGAAFGAMGHELGHAFGLSHDYTHDHNRRGNLMGNGFRGMRGFFRPDLTTDFCVLSEQNARIMNASGFFAVDNLPEG